MKKHSNQSSATGQAAADTKEQNQRQVTVCKQSQISDYRRIYLKKRRFRIRCQTYLHGDVYDALKTILPVIAPEISISNFITNIVKRHFGRA